MFHVKHYKDMCSVKSFGKFASEIFNSSAAIVAINTVREILRQPLFYFVICSGAGLMASSLLFTLFTFGEDIQMIREMGVSTITICCLCLASLSASHSVSKESERGTIITLLSKSVSRRAIILGKFFGLLGAAFAAFLMLGFLLVMILWAKDVLGYQSEVLPSLYQQTYPLFSQLTLVFLQIAIFCSIAIAGSVYLPIVSNLSFCMFLYIAGNLGGFFQGLLAGGKGGFLWYVSLFYVFIPNFEGFCAVRVTENVSSVYLALLTLYAALYTTFVLAVACEIFNRKECR